MVVRSQAVLGGWLQSTTANHLATAAEAANLGSAEAAKMPLSHKEGFAARSSKITPCFGALGKHVDTPVRCRKAVEQRDDELNTPIEFWAL